MRLDWKAHLFFGILAGAAVAYLLFSQDALRIAAFALLSGGAALLPDLDLRKSKASRLLYAAAFVAIASAALLLGGGKLEQALFNALALSLALLALDLLLRPRHRGMMHGLPFLAALSLVAYFSFGPFFASAIFTGYLSHLLADGCLKLAWFSEMFN